MVSKVKLIDLNKKEVKFDKKLGIYANGEDNAYPETTDRLVNNSVTAKMSSNLMSQFLVGAGLQNEAGQSKDDAIINTEHDTTLKQYADQVSHSITNNRGVFIHFDYTVDEEANFKPTNPKVLPFNWCRLGKKDDKLYNAKILIKKDWANSNEDAKVFDVYNTNQKVIGAQVEASQEEEGDGMSKYKGQIFFFNQDYQYFYPLSRIDAIMEDCDSERQAGVYKNQLLRNGFFGKVIATVRSLVDTSIEEFISERNDDGVPQQIKNPQYTEVLSEAEKTEQEIEDFLGAENAGGVMLLQTDEAGEELDSAIKIESIKSEIDADIFLNTESSIRDNILMAFNNLPIGLVKSNEGLFANSATAIVEMKKSYWESTEVERKIVEDIVTNTYNQINGTNEKITAKSFIEEDVEVLGDRIESQKQFRGSLAGVNALLAIQQSVSEGKTKKDAAVSMIEELYGISKDKAICMVGK